MSENGMIRQGTETMPAAMNQWAAAIQKQFKALGQAILTLEESNRKLQVLLEERLTVTSVQAKALQKAVAERARVFCSTNGIDYKAQGGKVRAAITKQVKQDFGVADFGDIPAGKYAAALEMIGEWTSFGLIRRLKK